MQLNERPKGAADALQPEQLAQRDPGQDVREQHVFPGQVQEPEGKAALTSPGRCYVRVLLLYPRVPAGRRGPSPAWTQLPSRGSLFSLPRPLQCSVPDSSWFLLPSGLLHWWLHCCLLRVRSKLY